VIIGCRAAVNDVQGRRPRYCMALSNRAPRPEHNGCGCAKSAETKHAVSIWQWVLRCKRREAKSLSAHRNLCHLLRDLGHVLIRGVRQDNRGDLPAGHTQDVGAITRPASRVLDRFLAM
jgi:hypothetical protein